MIKRILLIACIYLAITCAPWMIQAIMDMTFTQFFIVVLTLSIMGFIGTLCIAVNQDRYIKKLEMRHDEKSRKISVWYEHVFNDN